MKLLPDIYNTIKLDSKVVDIYTERLEIPYSYLIEPVINLDYPFPPLLIPIFSDGGDPSYLGLTYYPFSNRKRIFIKYDLSAGHMWEIARNSDQFLLHFLIDSIQTNDDEIDDEIESFAKIIELELELDSEFLTTYQESYNGNSFETYRFFKLFSSETPLSYCNDLSNYSGDFPSSSKLFNKSVINKSCSFEIAKDEYLKEVDNLPEWLNKNSNKKELFYKYIDTNELDKAWLTLNSTGWKLKDVADGLEVLKTKTTDELFHLVSDNWIEGMRQAKREEEAY